MKKQKGSFKSLGFVIKCVWQTHKWLFIIALLSTVFSVILNVYATKLMQPLIDTYILPVIGNEPLFDKAGFLRDLLIIAAIYFASALGSLVCSEAMVWIAQDTLFKIREDLSKKIVSLPLSIIDKQNTGDLMSLFSNDTDTLRQFISYAIPDLLRANLMIVFIIVMLFVINWLLAIFTIIILMLMFAIIVIISAKSSKHLIVQQQSLAQLNGYAEEMINAQKVIKVFGYENENLNKFNTLNNQLLKSSTRAFIYTNMAMPTTTNLSYLSYVFVAVLGAVIILNNNLSSLIHLSIGSLIIFMQLTRQISQPVAQYSQQVYTVAVASAGAMRIEKFLSYENEEMIFKKHVEYDDDKIYIVSNENKDDRIEFHGEFEFDNVRFSYVKGVEVIKGISFKVARGEKIAFVGATGAGKTSITSLINRFYEVDSGRILLDGVDIKEIDKTSLRSLMSYVLQDTSLFTDTVKQNIKYGNLEAEDDEIVEAAKLANADDVIKLLPHVYETIIDAQNSNLSQGQKQLLSIARAAVAKKPIIVLDEATSSIDTRTEKLIQDSLNKLMEGKTVFIIAHRLSTIKSADRIIVLDAGKIVECGRHDELIKNKARYYELYTGKVELD